MNGCFCSGRSDWRVRDRTTDGNERPSRIDCVADIRDHMQDMEHILVAFGRWFIKDIMERRERGLPSLPVVQPS